MKSELNALNRMIHMSPISVAQIANCTKKWSCPSEVLDHCFFFFSGRQTSGLSESPRGAEVTDDIFKCVSFQSFPFTFSSEVTALTSAWQFCNNSRAFLKWIVFTSTVHSFFVYVCVFFLHVCGQQSKILSFCFYIPNKVGRVWEQLV